jgi:hypothetical protein
LIKLNHFDVFFVNEGYCFVLSFPEVLQFYETIISKLNKRV